MQEMLNKKRLLIMGVIIMLTMFVGLNGVLAADSSETSTHPAVNVVINGEKINFQDYAPEQMAPVLIDGRTYLPVRIVAEKTGLPILWIPESNTVNIGDLSLSDNPLLKEWDTPLGTPPLDQVKPEHYIPALEYAIAAENAEILAIVNNPDEPTFTNTIVALERVGGLRSRIENILHPLSYAATNEQLQAVSMEASALLSDHSNDIIFNKQLFSRVEQVYQSCNRDQLTDEEQMLLERTNATFTRNGVQLEEDQQARMREIDSRLATLSGQFSQNLLADSNEGYVQVTDKAKLSGIPEYAVSMAKAEADEIGLEGWCFSLDDYNVSSLLTNADSREVRKEMKVKCGSLGMMRPETDNRPLIQEMVNLRLEKANILGYSSYADFLLEDRMAKTPQTVISFLDDLLSAAEPSARKDLLEVQEFAAEQGLEGDMQAHDYSYYANKLKQEKYQFDEEALRSYFELNNVKAGAFELANRLYGLTFVKNDNISVYHPDVETYEVYDDTNRFMGVIYLDYFAREGKSGGGWTISFRIQEVMNGQDVRPFVNVVYNFSKPANGEPVLLSFYDLTVFLHEFGHSLHGLLSDVNYASLSSYFVDWDFIELPSTIMENWAYEPEFLTLFARHYQTGALIPDEMIENIGKMRTVLNARWYVGMTQRSLLDMRWHMITEPLTEDVDSFEQEIMEPIRLFPVVEGTLFSPSLSHIFAGGYAAGFYSYEWAEMLKADAYKVFEKNGIFDRKTGDAFCREILSKGATQDQMELYKNFTGHEPSVEALLEKENLK